MNIVALAILWIFCSLAAFAQDRASDILTTGRQQLEKARTENSDSAFRQAEDTFTKALESDPDNVDAFTGRGEARNARGVIAFSKGAVGAGTALFTAAVADLDQAVALAPTRLDVHLIRGWTYGSWPAYVGKTGIAREDLEQAVAHAEFVGLSANQRAHALQMLGIVYTNFSETAKARNSFQSAVDAAPNSSFGKDAAKRLDALQTSGLTDRYLNLNLSFLGWPHTAVCLVAIAAFFPVMFTRKSGRTHRRWGRVYSVAYAVACLTSLGIYRGGQFIFAHWLALAGLAVLAAGYFAVRFKPPAWRYVHLSAMLLSAYNLFGGAVNEAFLRIKPLGVWTGGFTSPLFGMTHGLVMLLFMVLIVVYIVVTALRPALPAKSAVAAGSQE